MIMNYQDPALELMSQECVEASRPEEDRKRKIRWILTQRMEEERHLPKCIRILGQRTRKNWNEEPERAPHQNKFEGRMQRVCCQQ